MTLRALIRHFPLAAYFSLVYAVSLVVSVVVGLPGAAGGADHQAQAALVLFPVMVVAVGVIGVVLTAATDGLWGLWHLPVVDSLGAAHPHGRFWVAVFAAFVAVLAAIRVLIGWLSTNTGSVLLAQLLHASSTGCLVALGAGHVSAAQEALWYAVYAGVLWIGVAGVRNAF